MDAILQKLLPGEKQIKRSYRSIKNTDSPRIVAAEPANMLEIAGLNIAKGIEMTGGTLEMYIETLAIYYKDGHEKLKEIKDSLDAGNISDYTIYVHALKSASASIGAAEISETAKALEEAGKQEDLVYINAHTAQFLTDLQTVLSNISAAIPIIQPESREISGELRNELHKLKYALNASDAAAIDRLINNIKRKEHDNAFIGDMLETALTGAYEKAVLLIDELIE
jgi:HPt (histidine-containing phosphotransfer) domain-containing protein